MDRHPSRQHLRNLLPASLCRELMFIHKSCGVAGYRPFVLSTTLLHLIATNCSPLIMPFIPIRDKLKELIEEYYGCEYELFVEFTGLISWTKGAKIGWHSDNDRPYLKQRHFTAVCYLNSHAEDFIGGIFHFQNGTPATIVPKMGDVLIYKSEDVHCVDEVEEGERCTLALWFTLDSSFDEDAKILNNITGSQLQQSLHGLCNENMESTHPPNEPVGRPLAAASSMYSGAFSLLGSCSFPNFPSDIRLTRIMESGFEICVSFKNMFVGLQDIEDQFINGDFGEIHDVLGKPVKVKFNGQEISYIFRNAIHAVQVLCFCKWRKRETTLGDEENACGSLQLKIKNEELGLSDRIVPSDSSEHLQQEKEGNADACNAEVVQINEWNEYLNTCWKNLQQSYPIWKRFMNISAVS